MLNIPKSNLHTHSVFSDGRSSLDELCTTAIAYGFTSLGISDHSYLDYDDYGISENGEIEYVTAVRKCAEKYKGKLDVFCGIELDADSVCRRELYDYIIASVHALKCSDKYIAVDLSEDVLTDMINTHFNASEVDMAREYFSKFTKHIKAIKPHIVGHFDLFTKYSSIDTASSEYREVVINVLREIFKSCERFEVNTGAMARGYRNSPYPEDFILREILSLGGSVVVSSDCHDATKLDFAFEETIHMLRRIGFKYIDRYTTDGFVKDLI